MYTLYWCAKFIQKLTTGFKNHLRNLDNFRRVLENSESSNLMSYFCSKINLSKKYIALAKTLYTEYLTFNYLCGNLVTYKLLIIISSVLFQLKLHTVLTKVAH